MIGRQSLPKVAEDGVVILPFVVTGEAGTLGLRAQRSILSIVALEPGEAPTSSVAVTLAVLHHDVHAASRSFESEAVGSSRLEQVVYDDRPIGKPARPIPVERFWIGLVVVNAALGWKRGRVRTDEHALHVGPFAKFRREANRIIRSRQCAGRTGERYAKYHGRGDSTRAHVRSPRRPSI